MEGISSVSTVLTELVVIVLIDFVQLTSRDRKKACDSLYSSCYNHSFKCHGVQKEEFLWDVLLKDINHCAQS